MNLHKEIHFETAICEHLAAHGWLYADGDTANYDRKHALYLPDVLAWALEHDPGTAVRLALSLAPWWGLRGRLASQAPLLTAVAELADAGSNEWCAAHMFLAQVAGLTEDPPAALDHLTAARDALQDTSHSDDGAGPWLLSLCLGGRSSALIRVGRVAEALEDGRRALDLAREVGIGGLEAMALASLSLAVSYHGDRDGALRLGDQARQHVGEIRTSQQIRERRTHHLLQQSWCSQQLIGQLLATINDVQHILQIVAGQHVTRTTIGKRLQLGRDESDSAHQTNR